MQPDSLSTPDFEVLILAPIAKDAETATEFLRREGIMAGAFKDLPALCERLKEAAGAILIAEEALSLESANQLRDVLALQESWSNLPIILLTSHKERHFSTQNILEIFKMSGSVSILERPFHLVTFVAAVRVALNARERQYQVRTLLRQHEFAVRQRDEFLSIASHELKTPITSLKLQVQMRKRSLTRGDTSVHAPENVAKFLDFSQTQIERLSRLVDDMLDISRIVNGKLALSRAQVELGELADEVLQGFSGQFQAAGCEASLEIQSRVTGNWDRYRIEQVIANLFSNAIKYGGGKPVHVTVRSEGDRAVLIVRDQGMGIAPENQARIFKRFERAVIGNGISGLGLGLFITQQILELHEGTIQVESAVGRGATFKVTLPAASGASG